MHESGYGTAHETAPGQVTGTASGGVPGQGQARRRRRGRRWAWLLVAALVAGAGGAGATYWYNHRHQTSGSTAQDQPSPSASPSVEPIQIPAGYQLTHDAYGFSFGLPVGGDKPWVRTTPKGPIAITYTPDGIHKIIFGVTVANSRTAPEQAQWLIQQLKANDKSYQQLHFATNNYKNSQGAQLDFLFVDARTQQKMHAIEQFYQAPSGTEYDTFVSYPVDDWGNGYARFEEILQTLTVP
jgi:hypothetical protein